MTVAVRRLVHCRYIADFEQTETLGNRLPNSLRYVLKRVSTIMSLCAALYLEFKNRQFCFCWVRLLKWTVSTACCDRKRCDRTIGNESCVSVSSAQTVALYKRCERKRRRWYGSMVGCGWQGSIALQQRGQQPGFLRSGHTERGLPQRTAVSVRCGMLHSKQTLLTIIFWKHSS